MGEYNKVSLLVIIILMISYASAFSYTVSEVSLPQSKPYQGETVSLTATVTADSTNICTIVCQWRTNNYGPEDIGNPEPLFPKEPKQFGFKVLAIGLSGQVSDKLVVTCQRHSGCLWGDPDSIPENSISFSFNYPGDGICTTSKERCDSYGSYIKDAACLSYCINNKKECRPDSARGADNYGCATYCGNKLIEKDYETCSNCPIDVGKCDGLSCISGDECEGKYCVHEICWNRPYKEGDGFCDFNRGENCKNSVVDCSCKNTERCGVTAVCETYCGNGICELSEAGICKADCKWCGDGECNNNENCKSCQNDCGVCEASEINQEISTITGQAIKQSLEESKSRQVKVNLSAIGVIILFIIAYVLYKLHKKEKKKPHKIKKNEN